MRFLNFREPAAVPAAGRARPGPPPAGDLKTRAPPEARWRRARGTNLSGLMPFGFQKPRSQNGTDDAMIGRAASATGIPKARRHAAAEATDAAAPAAMQASMRAESFPATFSSYSPMSLWT